MRSRRPPSRARVVAFNIELLQTSQVNSPLSAATLPFCVPSTRVSFLYEDETGSLVKGSSPTHASAIVFMPPRDGVHAERAMALFREAFGPLGTVVIP